MKKLFIVLAFIVTTVFLMIYFMRFEQNNWRVSFANVNTLSSPRAVDLNQDNILDIVFGAGGREWEESEYGVIALDGKNGELLWKVKARNQISGSAIFQDVTHDSIEDVFISGRSAQLYSIDGSKWENFMGVPVLQ